MPYFFFYLSNSHVYKCHSCLYYTVNKLKFRSRIWANSSVVSRQKCWPAAPESLSTGSTVRNWVLGTLPVTGREATPNSTAGDKDSSLLGHLLESQLAGLLKTSFTSHHFRRITKSGDICMSHRKETFSYFCSAGNQT